MTGHLWIGRRCKQRMWLYVEEPHEKLLCRAVGKPSALWRGRRMPRQLKCFSNARLSLLPTSIYFWPSSVDSQTQHSNEGRGDRHKTRRVLQV
jgi:hypothetical protein